MTSSIITQQQIDEFLQKLQEDGKSQSVCAEYRRRLEDLYQTAAGNDYILNKEVLLEWRGRQASQKIAAGTVTNRVVKINHFLRYLGLEALCFPNGGRQDLAGQQFGHLIAIAPMTQKSSDRSICWKCRCLRCGKEKLIPANQLKKGVQISCGCSRANQLKENNGYVSDTCLKKVLSDTVSKNNTSGYKGVYLKRGKWAASIQYKKKNYYLGSFDRLEDAVAARKAAENRVREDAEQLWDALKGTCLPGAQKG